MTEKIVRPEQRLSPGARSRSKYVGKNPNEDRDRAVRAAELEKSRERLFALVQGFTGKLHDKVLFENLSVKDREEQEGMPKKLYEAALELNSRNVGEGNEVLFGTCLYSLLYLKDECNRLAYQNYYLNEELQKLKPKP